MVRGIAGLALASSLAALSGCSDLGKPALPVDLSARPSQVGIGTVVQFHNRSGTPLTVQVAFENRKRQQRKEGTLDLPAGGTVEIGWLEGWTFESGETVQLSHPKFASRSWTVP